MFKYIYVFYGGALGAQIPKWHHKFYDTKSKCANCEISFEETIKRVNNIEKLNELEAARKIYQTPELVLKRLFGKYYESPRVCKNAKSFN